ncbi:MAG: glycine zipper 2TM domain-containing protein, partial [Rhodospirillales bacterium]
MNSKRITLTLVAVIFFAACADAQERPKQSIGTLLGAGVGALAGSQVGKGRGKLAAVAIGTLAGAWAGSEIGKSLDKADRLYAQRTAQNSLEHNRIGQTSTWQNPDSGHSGTYTPTRTYQTLSGQNCREYETTINVGGRME